MCWKGKSLLYNYLIPVEATMNQTELTFVRADSPVTTIITTTTSQPVSLPIATAAIHSTLVITAPTLTHINGNFNQINGNVKQNNEQKHRICRDFVRGHCRRQYCKVSF